MLSIMVNVIFQMISIRSIIDQNSSNIPLPLFFCILLEPMRKKIPPFFSDYIIIIQSSNITLKTDDRYPNP